MSGPETAPPSHGATPRSAQDLSDAELAELGGLLAAIPEPLDPLDPVMLDGYLCGVVVQPELLAADEWLPFVWDAQGHRWGEAVPGPEQVRARALVLRRYASLNRSLVEFGAFDPWLPEPSDDRDADPAGADGTRDAIDATLGPWVAGFEQAVELFPALAELRDPAVGGALKRILHLGPARGAVPARADASTRADAGAVADASGVRADAGAAADALGHRVAPAVASFDAALDEIVAAVAALHVATEPLRYRVDAVRRDSPKVGRNEPCPCGSGRKFKQCHGAPDGADRP